MSMIYRSLGKTGTRVSEIGMGCNRLGEAGLFSDRESGQPISRNP
jgi:aryl-alcohol dehydrogenase-like predicted oxidoreductase